MLAALVFGAEVGARVRVGGGRFGRLVRGRSPFVVTSTVFGQAVAGRHEFCVGESFDDSASGPPR
jgi:hypothetical protein